MLKKEINFESFGFMLFEQIFDGEMESIIKQKFVTKFLLRVFFRALQSKTGFNLKLDFLH